MLTNLILVKKLVFDEEVQCGGDWNQETAVCTICLEKFAVVQSWERSRGVITFVS